MYVTPLEIPFVLYKNHCLHRSVWFIGVVQLFCCAASSHVMKCHDF